MATPTKSPVKPETPSAQQKIIMGNEKKIILDLCGGTGAWSKPYKDAGYDVKLITLPKYDVRKFALLPGDEIYGILAAPPCDEFSIAKDHKIKRNLNAGMEIVNACLEVIRSCNPKFWALENPAGLLSRFIGKPKYSFQPWWFGDGWTKRTMIWGDFNIPRRQYYKYEDCPKISELYIRPGRKTASIAFNHKNHKRFIKSFDPFEAETDASFRAITPQGFAKAFYKANK